VTTDVQPESARSLDSSIHPHCVVCGRKNPRGLNLHFSLTDDASAKGSFFCSKALEGYPDRVHGGVIASVLDGAMTNCLFLHGLTGVTVELNIRYKRPVDTDRIATVRGWIERSSSLLHILKAELVQGNEVKATASGKFMNLSDSPKSGR